MTTYAGLTLIDHYSKLYRINIWDMITAAIDQVKEPICNIPTITEFVAPQWLIAGDLPLSKEALDRAISPALMPPKRV